MLQFSHLVSVFKHSKIFVMLLIAGVIMCIVKPATSDNTISVGQSSENIYPDHIINTVMKKNGNKFAAFFGSDIIPEEKDLVSRNAGECLNFICKTKVKLEHPKMGTTKEDKNVTIVNTDEYSQGVRMVLCENPGKPCQHKHKHPRTTECVQMHYLRKVVAIDLKTNTTFKEDVLIPSGCGCVEIH